MASVLLEPSQGDEDKPPSVLGLLEPSQGDEDKPPSVLGLLEPSQGDEDKPPSVLGLLEPSQGEEDKPPSVLGLLEPSQGDEDKPPSVLGLLEPSQGDDDKPPSVLGLLEPSQGDEDKPPSVLGLLEPSQGDEDKPPSVLSLLEPSQEDKPPSALLGPDQPVDPGVTTKGEEPSRNESESKSSEELSKVTPNDIYLPEEMRHFLPPERLAALKEHESAERNSHEMSRPLWSDDMKAKLFTSSDKESNFFSWMFLDKIFSPKRPCSSCGARGTGKLPPGDNSLELFVAEKGLVGKQNILCSSCKKVELIMSCDHPDEIPTDTRLKIKGEQIQDLCKKISHYEVLHDLMELLHIAAIEEPVVKKERHLELAEFLLVNARKICEQWCKKEYRELRLKKFIRFREEALLMTYNPNFTPDCSAEYKEMYEMMANSFRQNRDHIHTILQAIRDTLIDSPSRSFCMLWMGISMMHADNYKKFKERYDPRSYMRVDEGEYWGLHDRYLGLDAPLGVKKIPIVFVLFEIPRFHHYVEFLEKKCGRRAKVYLTEDERYQLTRVDKEAKKRGFMHPRKSGVMISPHAHLDFLVRQEELIKMTRSKEQETAAKKSAKKQSSDPSKKKKSNKSSTKSAKIDTAPESSDQTVAAKKKEETSANSTPVPLPSMDKIMSVARDCQIRIDDKELRDKIIAAGFKAMEERKRKIEIDETEAAVVANIEHSRDTVLKKSTVKSKSKEVGEKKTSREKKEEKSKDGPVDSSNVLSPEKMYLTDEIGSGRQGDVQSLKEVKKTDFLPPEAISPEDMYPTKSSTATRDELPSSPETNYNSKLEEALEKEPVVKSKPKPKPKPDQATHPTNSKTKEKPAPVKVQRGKKATPTKKESTKWRGRTKDITEIIKEAKARVRLEMLAQAREMMVLAFKGMSDNSGLDIVKSNEQEDYWDDLVGDLLENMNRKRREVDKEFFDPNIVSREDYRTVIREEFAAYERRRTQKKKKVRVFKPEIDPESPLAGLSFPKHPKQGLPDYMMGGMGGKFSPSSLLCAQVGTDHLRAQGYKVDTDSTTVAVLADHKGVIYQIIDGIDSQEELQQYLQQTYKLPKKAMSGGTAYLTMPSKDNPGGLIAQPEIQDDYKVSGNPKKAKKKARQQAKLLGPKPKRLAGKTVTIGEHTYTPEDVRALADGTHHLLKNVKEVDESIDPMDEVAMKAAHPWLKHVENTTVAPPDQDAFEAVMRKMMSPIPLEGVDPTAPRHIVPFSQGHLKGLEAMKQSFPVKAYPEKPKEDTEESPKTTPNCRQPEEITLTEDGTVDLASLGTDVIETLKRFAGSELIDKIKHLTPLELLSHLKALREKEMRKERGELDEDSDEDSEDKQEEEGVKSAERDASTESIKPVKDIKLTQAQIAEASKDTRLLGFPPAGSGFEGQFSSPRKQMRMLDAMGIPYRIDTVKIIHPIPPEDDTSDPKVSICSKITLLPYDKPKEEEKKPSVETDEPKMSKSQRKKAKRRQMAAQSKADTPSPLLSSQTTAPSSLATPTLETADDQQQGETSSTSTVGSDTPRGGVDDIDEEDSSQNSSGSSRGRTTARDRFKTCFNCDEEIVDRIQLCAGCKKVAYCNFRCQKAHWKTHKKSCSYALKKDPKDSTG